MRFWLWTSRKSGSIVVATTRPMSNSSTTSKSLRQISSGEHELCNSQENSTGNYNSILPTIYIKSSWSMLRLLYTYPNVHALSSCPLLIYHTSTSRLACHVHVPWHHTLNSTLNLCCPCMHHMYTMRNHVPWRHFISRLFLILLDCSRLF